MSDQPNPHRRAAAIRSFRRCAPAAWGRASARAGRNSVALRAALSGTTASTLAVFGRRAPRVLENRLRHGAMRPHRSRQALPGTDFIGRRGCTHPVSAHCSSASGEMSLANLRRPA